MSNATDLLDHLLDTAVSSGASDVHLEPRQSGTAARIRRDGMLLPVLDLTRERAAAVVQRIKAISGLDVTERQKPQDGRFSRSVGSREVEFRVSVLPAIFGESVVLRVLDRAATGLCVEGLGADEPTSAALRALVDRPHGLVLVAGPTGSGKTTTLYAVIGELDRTRLKVMTVEDPIEYELSGTIQLEISPRFDVTFGSAVRAMLRQDPDVILVGEIRDPQTAAAALEASLTGHLVLATLHAADSATALRRLIDLGASRSLLVESVAALVTQRLLLKLCPACRVPLESSPAWLGDDPGTPFESTGCRQCNNLGFRGRFGLFEIVLADPVTAAALLEDQQAPLACIVGGRTLREQAIASVGAGLTSPDEVKRKILGGSA